MRVLFVYPNSQRRTFTPQVGIASLSAVLKQNGHVCDLYDLTMVPLGKEKQLFVDKVREFKPDLIGYSIRSSEVSMVRALLEAVPKDKVISVAGGHHVTVAPQETMEMFDIVVRGEAEEALLEMVQRMEAGESLRDVRNVWVRENGTIYENELRPLIANLDELPYPDWQLFDRQHYTNHYLRSSSARTYNVIGTFEGSRGCVFSCTYCSSPTVRAMYGGTVWRREKSAERLADEINAFEREFGLDFMYFIDEIFLTKVARVREIRDVFRERVKKPFTFMERPELMTEEKVKLIAEAGAAAVAIGVESGNEEFRKKVLNRKMPQGKIVEAFGLAKRYGLWTHAFNMVGLPYETREIVEENFELLRRLKPDSYSSSIYYPLYGTVLYGRVKNEGWLNSEERAVGYFDYMKQASLTMPDGLSREEISRYQRLIGMLAGHRSRFAGWLFRFLARHGFWFRLVDFTIRAFNVKLFRDRVRRYGLIGLLREVSRRVRTRVLRA